jgi:transporter family-2 protein
MNTMLALLCGALIAVANVVNAQLGGVYGQYIAPIIIHGSGLLLISFLCIGKYRSIRGIPKRYLVGGVLGLLTVVLCNLSSAHMGVTLMMVLTLLGQTVSSMVVDGFGIMGLEKKKINKNRVISLGLITIGVVVMLV